MFIMFQGNFVPIKYVIIIFLTDFLIRVFINPKYSPTMIIARMIVSKQTPEYVGAPQKKFAWVIGVVLSAVMFVFMVIVNAYSPITGIICLICLIFLFFESAFGICLGCMFYPLFYKEKVQLCPGDVCEKKEKQEIQKVSWRQIVILLFFTALVVAVAVFLNDMLSEKPYDLFGIGDSK